jgi:dUTPase
MGVQDIPTEIYGPLPKDTVGLIFGRSTMTLWGLQIHPGIIDQDYMEELKILAQVP